MADTGSSLYLGENRQRMEYFFWQAVEAVSSHDGVPPITARQAREMREHLDTVLARPTAQKPHGTSMDFQFGATNRDGSVAYDPMGIITSFFPAMDTVFAERVPGHTPMFDAVTTATTMAQLTDGSVPGYRPNEYARWTEGFAMMKEGADGPARFALSPYDPRYASRAVTLKAGTELLSVPVAEVRAATADTTADAMGDLDAVADPSVRLSVSTATPDESGDLTEMGSTFDEFAGDAAGLAAFAPYMSTSEYRDAVKWCRDVPPANRPDGASLAVAVSILNYLDDNGVPYEITRDRNPGQLTAKIAGVGGSRTEVRLTDPEDKAWVGRIYDNGSVIRYTPADSSVNSGKDKTLYRPTAAEAVDLLRFVRGEQIVRSDGGIVGTVGTVGTRPVPVRSARRNGATRTQWSYHNAGSQGGYSGDGARYGVSDTLDIISEPMRDGSVNAAELKYFKTRNDAVEQLVRWIDTARETTTELLDVDGLVEEVEAGIVSGVWDGSVGLTGNPTIDAIRSDYVLLLTGQVDDLLDTGADPEDVDAWTTARLDETGGVAGTDTPSTEGVRPVDALTVEKVRAHAARVPGGLIGDFHLVRDPERSTSASGLVYDTEGNVSYDGAFNPVMTASLMDMGQSVWRNTDDLIAALRAGELSDTSLTGEKEAVDSIVDRLITFDPSTAMDMRLHPDSSVAALADVVEDTVATHGGHLDVIFIDDNGVAAWQATRVVGPSGEADSAKRTITGTFGQVLPKGPYGEVVTKYAASENFLTVPGYTATVEPAGVGDTRTLEERTRVTGYDEAMADALRRQIIGEMTTNRGEVGRPTSLNSVARRSYGTRYDTGFIERAERSGLSREWVGAVLGTEALRVKYGNEFAEGSTARTAMEAESRGVDMRNDLSRSPFVVTGGRNMSVLDTVAGAGVFDPAVTGTAKNQGTVRFLVPSASVTADGHIVPGFPDDRVPLMTMPETAAMRFDSWDRQNMTTSNLLQASAVVPGVRAAMTQLGGLNFEDGAIVSADFARAHLVPDTNGVLRPQSVGDKIADFHGNKSVISAVVDPTLSDEQARESGMLPVVEFFRNNPDLEVVMSPASPVSRFNGGTARELMSAPGVLRVDDGEGNWVDVPGGTGALNIIVTDKMVDEKTHAYDEEAVAGGKGRKISHQLKWALDAKEADTMSREFYGPNDSGVATTREYLVALGFDLSPTGELHTGTHPESGERTLLEMPDLPRRQSDGAVINRQLRSAVGRVFSASGGDMLVPFPITMPSGAQTPLAESVDGVRMYRLPVVSASLRNDQELGDGSVSRHDYTSRYIRIAMAGVDYSEAVRKLGELSPTDPDYPAKAGNFAKDMNRAVASAKREYAWITDDIVDRKIEGKNNMFKSNVMSRRVGHSATAVWTGDPRLDVDEIAMSSDMARTLGALKDDGTGNMYTMIWRDPVLRDSGLRYMRVKIDDSLVGVAVNPASVQGFDGDFDGDTVGLHGGLSAAAHAEALEKFSFEANLLDHGKQYTAADEAKNPAHKAGNHPLATHTGLDVAVACNDPEVRAWFDNVELAVNEVEKAYAAGDVDLDTVRAVNSEQCAALSKAYHVVFEDAGTGVDPTKVARLNFSDIGSHMASVAAMVESGMKGNPNSKTKVARYAQYLGVHAVYPATGAPVDMAGYSAAQYGDGTLGWVDDGGPDAEFKAEADAGSQKATAIKTQYTGVAGARSQTAVILLRNAGFTLEACELGYPATQAMLQAKHDPDDAVERANGMSAYRNLWKGYKMTSEPGPNGKLVWSVEYEQGEPVSASREEWVAQFEAINGPDCMDVNVGADVIERVSHVLSDPETGQMFRMDLGKPEELTLPEELKPCPLDMLAYRGSLDMLKDYAESGADLFTGAGETFAPRMVLENRNLLDEMEAGRVDPATPMMTMAKRDVASLRSPVAATVIPSAVSDGQAHQGAPGVASGAPGVPSGGSAPGAPGVPSATPTATPSVSSAPSAGSGAPAVVSNPGAPGAPVHASDTPVARAVQSAPATRALESGGAPGAGMNATSAAFGDRAFGGGRSRRSGQRVTVPGAPGMPSATPSGPSL